MAVKADRGLRYLTLAVVGVFWLAGCAIRPITPELTHFDPDAGYRWDPAVCCRTTIHTRCWY